MGVPTPTRSRKDPLSYGLPHGKRYPYGGFPTHISLTGTYIDAPPTPRELLALDATIHNILIELRGQWRDRCYGEDDN